MKSAELTPNSSVKSSSTATPTSMESETRDSNYYPGCEKNAKCTCEMCIASIKATLDLLPQSTLTKISASKPTLPRDPIPFDPSNVSPSKSRIPPDMGLEPLNITEDTNSYENEKTRMKGFGKDRIFMVGLILSLSFLWAAEYGFSWVLFRVVQPKLTPNMFRNFAESSLIVEDLNQRLFFLKKEIWGMVAKDSPNCSYEDSSWKIDQDGLLLHSRYVLYRSVTEEVSIWGWPLQTAGLLTAEFSSRSFTILSGRLTEWRNGEVSYLIRKTNSSWTQQKWSYSAVQLDPNTWILEYRRRSIMENARLISAAVELLKLRLKRVVRRMQPDFRLLYASGRQYTKPEWSSEPPPT